MGVHVENPITINADQGTSRQGHRPKKAKVLQSHPVTPRMQSSKTPSAPLNVPSAEHTSAVNQDYPDINTLMEPSDVAPGTSATSVRINGSIF